MAKISLHHHDEEPKREDEQEIDFSALNDETKQRANELKAETLRIIQEREEQKKQAQDSHLQEMQATIARMAAIAAEREARNEEVQEQEARKLAPEKPKEHKGEEHSNVIPLRLPIWPQMTRGTPNSFLRGALFAAIQGKSRRQMKREVIASQGGITIRFTGEQLNQSDLDVWEQAVHLAKDHPLGNVCHFKLGGFLRALGRDVGKANYEWLKDTLARLTATCVEITAGKYTYGGNFLNFIRIEETGEHVLKLNHDMMNLWLAGWTAIDWDVRLKLKRKPLALWLHGWLSSNAENYPIKVETLQRLSGCNYGRLRDFKRQVSEAIQSLQNAGVCVEVEFENDLAIFIRQPKPTQIRYKNNKKIPNKIYK